MYSISKSVFSNVSVYKKKKLSQMDASSMKYWICSRIRRVFPDRKTFMKLFILSLFYAASKKNALVKTYLKIDLTIQFFNRCFTRGTMPMVTDEFSSTRHIVDVEMTYSHSTKHKQFSQRTGNLSIREERSSHGYADIDDLDPDDYENVKERLSDTDSDDYENLRSGIWNLTYQKCFKQNVN